jgi:nucleotide-binding universal stress UspA family protein
MSSRANELNSAEWEKQIMKRVLVPLTGRPPDRRALTAAFLVAERFRGHIDGLCVMPHAEFHTPVESTALPAALTRRLTKIAQEGQAQFVTAARQTFDDYSTRHSAAMTPEAGAADADSLTAWWTEATGSLPEIVAQEARLADLVVFAQDPDVTDAMGNAIEAAVFSSGRPLVLAPAPEPASLGTAVALAWDGGPTAARAVTAALPFLRDAATVVILSAHKPGAAPTADPNRLAAYLAWHGITATPHAVSAGGRSLSTALTETAVELGCDLLVMGAYGHSRFREMVLGGVTQDILRQPPGLPILMAH